MAPLNLPFRLIAFALILATPTFVHDPWLLTGGLFIALVAAGPRRWQSLRRTLVAILVFNLSVSLAYLLVAVWQGKEASDWLVLANLRVLLMVYLGTWLPARLRLFDELLRFPTFRLIGAIALGQIRVFSRMLEDTRLAFASRNVVRPRLAARLSHAAAQGAILLEKAESQGEETMLALRSRGVFDA